jgi:hypothetical protein
LRNGCADILAVNRLGYALCSELFTGPARPANTARFVFLDPRAAGFFVDWDRVASEVVATLRSQAGRDPCDRGLSDLVGALSTRSEEFGTRWAEHNVRRHRTGRKQLHHPVVGDLRLTYEVMDLSADPGLSLVRDRRSLAVGAGLAGQDHLGGCVAAHPEALGDLVRAHPLCAVDQREILLGLGPGAAGLPRAGRPADRPGRRPGAGSLGG